MTINSKGEWASAIEDAEQVMLRWGHGQVRRVPDEIVEAIVAALRSPVSERLRIPAGWRLVPTKPTDAMLDAMAECFTPAWVDLNSRERIQYTRTAEAAYLAMLDKALSER